MKLGKPSVHIFWFRRDLRLHDNAALHHALKSGIPVLPIFIFDREILDKLEDQKDLRVQFIHQELAAIREKLKAQGSDLAVYYGDPKEIWKFILKQYSVAEVYANRDYEPYAKERDGAIKKLLKESDIELKLYKDHIIFEPKEILKDDGTPYVVYTPYSKKWLAKYTSDQVKPFPIELHRSNFFGFQAHAMPSLDAMGFEATDFTYPDRSIDISLVEDYGEKRDYPAKNGTSRLSMHLRFGTVSIRELTKIAKAHGKFWLNELIWRNFYQMIIAHFPERIENSFKEKYDRIPWRKDEAAYRAWCEGRTGYPIVDAGMRELNATGFMHNRVRMVVASFLTKHLLIDWRLGEAYFAQKLLDFELASNNGGWQWASGSGCDAAPYFRVFNPELQTKKFDPNHVYIRKWVPEYLQNSYPEPIVEHKQARLRAIETYKTALA